MKTVKLSVIAIISILILCTAQLSLGAKKLGPYVGLGLGGVIHDGEQTTAQLQPFVPETLVDSKTDDDDFAYKAILGWQVNRYFAVEAAYYNLGEVETKEELLPSYDVKTTTKFKGFGTYAVGHLPLARNKLSIFGKIGLYHSYAKGKIKGQILTAPAGGDIDESKNQLALGLGLDLKLIDRLKIRGEWEYLGKTETNADFFFTGTVNEAKSEDYKHHLFSLSMLYLF